MQDDTARLRAEADQLWLQVLEIFRPMADRLVRWLDEQEREREHLTPEGQHKAQSLLTGTTTSTVTQVWACGHQVGSVNGDSLYASCPICFTKKREAGDGPYNDPSCPPDTMAG